MFKYCLVDLLADKETLKAKRKLFVSLLRVIGVKTSVLHFKSRYFEVLNIGVTLNTVGP